MVPNNRRPFRLARVSGTWMPVGAENLDGSGNAEIIWRQVCNRGAGRLASERIYLLDLHRFTPGRLRLAASTTGIRSLTGRKLTVPVCPVAKR